MTDIVAVVYNNNITANVTNSSQAVVSTVGNQDISSSVTSGVQPVVSAVGIQGASGTRTNLEYATNVDSSNLENGSLLIYNNNSALWVASRYLVAQDMDAGEF